MSSGHEGPLEIAEQAITDVIKERGRQDAKWGEQNHHPFLYLTVLMEEVGEASQAALQATFGGMTWADYRKEVVQAAAVAVAMIEAFDRGKWQQCEDYYANGGAG